mmetsp:Transcript_19777/g.48358  ORF Transcript_19777/g.48358 Transcript_19777/m.48358 type:complete len:195 (+) Transcript_19777:1-585(+)
MRDPEHWPRSVYFSHSIMATAYGVTAIVGYYFQGNDVPAYLPAGLPKGPGKVIVNLLVAYHVLVAYVINNVPLMLMFKRRFLRGKETPLSQHFLLAVGILWCAWLLTNLIPFFEDMVSIIGALCGSPIMLGLPPLFYYSALKKKGRTMSRFDMIMCFILFFFLFPFTFFAGMISAFKSLLENWQQNGPPFTCRK